jgi:hypothetical protein
MKPASKSILKRAPVTGAGNVGVLGLGTKASLRDAHYFTYSSILYKMFPSVGSLLAT